MGSWGTPPHPIRSSWETLLLRPLTLLLTATYCHFYGRYTVYITRQDCVSLTFCHVVSMGPFSPKNRPELEEPAPCHRCPRSGTKWQGWGAVRNETQKFFLLISGITSGLPRPAPVKSPGSTYSIRRWYTAAAAGHPTCANHDRPRCLPTQRTKSACRRRAVA